MDELDKAVVSGIIEIAFAEGYTLSVNDGEEDVLLWSSKAQDVWKAVGSTGEDHITLSSANHKDEGSFFLIYDNRSEGEMEDGEFMVTIADYSDSEVCRSIYDQLEAKAMGSRYEVA